MRAESTFFGKLLSLVVGKSLFGQCLIFPVDGKALRWRVESSQQYVIELVEVVSARFTRNEAPADFLEKPLQHGESRTVDLVSHFNRF